MKNADDKSMKKIKAIYRNAKRAGGYILSVNKKLYLNNGLMELVFPIASVIYMSAMASVTDIITRQQKDYAGRMLAGICMTVLSEFLLNNLFNIIEAFKQMSEMDVWEACKTDLLKAMKNKSLDEIENPDIMDEFSMHMSKSIYSVSSSGFIVFRMITAAAGIVSAAAACLLNKVNLLYFAASAATYGLLLPFLLKIEGRIKKYHNESYKRLAGIERRQKKIASLFQNKDYLFDIKRRNIASPLIEKYMELHNDTADAHMREDKEEEKMVDKLSWLSSAYMSVLHMSVYLLVLFHYLSYGSAVLLISCAVQFNQSIRNFAVEIKFLDESMFLTNEFFDFIRPSVGAAEASVGPVESISLKNVSYQYGAYKDSGRYQLSDVSLNIRKGEKIAVVGENGSGKTTLIKVIMGLYRPTSGECFINGVSYSKLDQNDILKAFSIAAQDTTVYPLSLKENITISNRNLKRENDYDFVCGAAGIAKLREEHGGDEVLLRKEIFKDAVEFSGGEKQKIKLARALYADREIMVFDEPFSSLDIESELKFTDLIFNTYKERTVIIVTHNLACTKLCSRIISMKDGRVQESGSHRQLLKNKGLYCKMYMAQALKYREAADEQA